MARSLSFEVIDTFTTKYAPTKITQYGSRRSGMRVVVVDRHGPKINGYFTLATEIRDDSGAPHTLEHLCFMGSKSYPYKGLLDKMATRAYSNTNAWTAVDHTAYTLDSAGWAGFAQILPIYLEHILAPTITDAACLTEVHHIDGEGNDAGVVYSEMQGVQNDQAELMDLANRRLLYSPNQGFRYETGGMMEQLRELSADRIRDFHKAMYQARNLCLVIVGSVDHQNLLDVLDKFELDSHDSVSCTEKPLSRPWTQAHNNGPCLSHVTKIVEFPEEDETMGEVMISWFGPKYDESLHRSALIILLRYLASTSASILDNILVEKEQLASAVYYNTEIRPDILIEFTLSGVKTPELSRIQCRFHEILQEASSNALDMGYLKECIDVERRQIKFQAETSALYFADPIMRDFVYGNRDGSSLRRDIQSIDDYNILETWEEARWQSYMKTWFVDSKGVSILGTPSKRLAESIKSKEENRIRLRKEELGQEGLQKLAVKLAQAQAENDQDIPKSCLTRFEIPDPASIDFINTTTACAGSARASMHLDNFAQRLIDKDVEESKLFLHFESIQSSFVNISILMDTDALPDHLRPLLSLYMELFFASPMQRDGQIVEFEQVVKEIERDTVGYNISTGQSLGNSESVLLSIQAEVGDYQKAIRWLRDLIFSSVYDEERIESTLARLLAEIPDEKRSGSDMVSAVDDMLISTPRSIIRARNTLVRAIYLRKVRKMLRDDPAQVIGQLQEISQKLCQMGNLRVLVIADIEQLSCPVSSWNMFTTSIDHAQTLCPLQTRYSRMTDLGKSPGNAAYLVPMSTIDSSYLNVDAKGPNSYFDESIPALMVAAAYLNAVEGPLWTAVRGTGLAYGTYLQQHVDAGQISLVVYRSPDAFKALNASKKVIEDHVSGLTSFDPLALEGSISSIVLELANKESSPANAAIVSFVRQVVRGQPRDWPRRILDKVRHVTPGEIKQVMRDVILALFKPESSLLVVTCAPIMEEKLQGDLRSLGYCPEVRPLSFFQDDYGIGPANVGPESDEEEEEEDEGSGEEEDSEGSGSDDAV